MIKIHRQTQTEGRTDDMRWRGKNGKKLNILIPILIKFDMWDVGGLSGMLLLSVRTISQNFFRAVGWGYFPSIDKTRRLYKLIAAAQSYLVILRMVTNTKLYFIHIRG